MACDVQWTGVAHLTDAGDCFASDVYPSEPTMVGAAAHDMQMSSPAPILISVAAAPPASSKSPIQPRKWNGLCNESTDLASLNFMPSPSPPRRRRPSHESSSQDASSSDQSWEAPIDADGVNSFPQTIRKTTARASMSTGALLEPVPWQGLAVRSSASDVFCMPSPSPPTRRRRSRSTPTGCDQTRLATSPKVTKKGKENVCTGSMHVDFGSDGYHVLSPLSTLSLHAR